MANLGSLYYTLGIKDLTQADFDKINRQLKNAGAEVTVTPKLGGGIKDQIPKGLTIKLDPELNKVSNDALARAVEGKVMKVEILPLITNLRQALKAATTANPPEIEIGVNQNKLRDLVTRVLSAQGYMVNINTVTGLEKAITTQLNGRSYNVTIKADARAIANSVQASLMNVQSRQFGLTVAKDVLRNSIDQALMGKPFDIQIAVMHDQARRAVQNALNNARMVGKDDALAFQRLQTGELRAAQAELARLRAEQLGAANAANTHASASINLGGAMGSNIRIAGELGAAMASLYSIHAAKEFLSQVIEIGGELEHQKIALETIYGSGSKMESLYSQIKGLARQSPFGVMDLTKNIKQLSAYGVAYNEVYDTAKRLADISAATSVDINRLILAFGKTKNRTFLDGLEAKQFAYANIPIYDALSKKLTELEGKFVSVKDVMGRIKKREIGFDIVKDILWEMTDEGGKFYNMQEKLAGSVKTSWKLVRDNIDLMFGEIAESGVGSGLKWIAEVLQGLTREWKAMFTILGTGVGVFAIAKAAMMGVNTVMGSATAATLRQAAAQRAAIVANNEAVLKYRALTAAEETNMLAANAARQLTGLRILSTKKLVLADVEAAYAKKMLTREHILQLVALKKLTAADAQYILTTVGMTQAEIAAMNAEIARAEAAKRSSVIFSRLGASIKGALAPIGAMLFNPMTAIMAALGAVMALWHRNGQEMERAEEVGKSVFNKAIDGAKELNEVLDGLRPSSELSTLELTQGIEKLQEKIKDFSPTPIEDINNSLVAQDGHIRTLAEQYDYLKTKVQGYAVTMENIKAVGLGNATETALKATDGSNWFTQLFDDGLEENMKDYDNALKKREERLNKFMVNSREKMVKIVDYVKKMDASFASETSGMASYEQKFTHLVENFNRFKVGEFWEDLSDISNLGKINDTYNELISDTDKFMQSINATMLSQGMNPEWLKYSKEQLKELTDEQRQKLVNWRMMLTLQLRTMVDSFEKAGDDSKTAFLTKLAGDWNIDLVEDNIGPKLTEAIKRSVNTSADAGIETIRRKLENEGYAALSASEKKVVDKLMEDAKKGVMKELKLTNEQMADYLQSHPLTQIITLAYQVESNDLFREIVKQKGYPGSTGLPMFAASTGRLVRSWTSSGNIYESRNAAQEALQNAKNELDAAKKAGVGIEKAQKEYNEVMAAINYLGWTDLRTKDQKSNKTGGTQKDTVAEALKQRFKDIKDAWSEFQKWSKTEGREAAAKRIGESGLFSTLDKDKIPQTVEQYRKLVIELEDDLRTAGIAGHSQRESLLNDLLKQILDIDKTQVDEQLNTALDKVGKEAERQVAEWNLFDKIRKATGNDGLAMSIAFGLNADAETDYVAMVKKQFNAVADLYDKYKDKSFDAFTPDILKDAPDEIRKAWEKAYKDIQSYRDKEREEMADMVVQYRTTQEEIVALTAEAEEKKRKIRNDKTLSPKHKQQITDRIDADLNYQIFQKSGQYLKFFNAALSLTKKEAEDVGRKIKDALDKKLQAGTISAKEYCEEMEKINKKLDEIREKQKGFGGFGSFLDGGLQKMFEDRYSQAESDYNAATQDFDNAKQQFDLFSKEGNQAGMQQAQSAMDAASSMQAGAGAAMQGAQGAMSTVAVIDKIVHAINDSVQSMREAFYDIKDMADSFGADTSADTDWGAAGAFFDAFSQASDGATKAWDSLKSGNGMGVIQGVIQSITSWFTVFNRWHDAKLQKQIERSKEVVDNVQKAYDAIERRMTNFLGNGRNLQVFDIEQSKKDLDALEKELAEKQQKYAEMSKRFVGKGYAVGTTVGGLAGAWVGAIVGSLIGNISDLRASYKKKKLEKEINALYEERARLQARIEAYQKGGAYGLQRQMMKEQLEELNKQKADMEDMKKKDKQAISDIEDEIDELTIQIRDFAIETAKDLYDIDLNGWAEQLGDALVDAFAAGEDAAEAFDKTVGDIMRSVTKKMISEDILAPLFGDLRDYLFGVNGEGGAFGEDFQLDASEMGAVKDYLDIIRNKGIPAAEELYNAINDATGGLLTDTDKSKSGMTAGLQSLTEDTGDLIASYMNAIRADVSEGRLSWERLLNESLPQINVIAESQLAAQRQIAENTLRNAVAAEAIVKSNDEINRRLARVTQGAEKFYVQ